MKTTAWMIALALSACAQSPTEMALLPSGPPPQYVSESALEPGAESDDSWVRVQGDNDRLNLQAYFKTEAKWPSNANGDYVIGVCWENSSGEDGRREREEVRTAIEQSWVRYSRLRFFGWETCAPVTERFLRIHVEDVADEGPRVLRLGKFGAGVAKGMTLNFTFRNWGPLCAETDQARLQCIRSIAVHEFGHAIGFAHEHNRHDRPGECRRAPQGSDGDVLLTPYDPHSVMNYCNPEYNNLGVLSACDRRGVQAVYGVRPGIAAETECRRRP